MELAISSLEKTYKNGVRALDNLSLTLGPGVHGILGPNGAGKSTLMQILTCNLEPSSGMVLWNGMPIKKEQSAYCAVLGYMPQQQALYPSFTPVDYLNYVAALWCMNKKHTSKAVEEVLRRVELTDVANRKIAALSGGMRQRLLLAQAIIHNPKVLILDEPTAGLDPYQRNKIKNIIAELSADCIILLATHVVSDIEVIANDVILLKEGKVIKHGTPSNLCQSIHGKVYEVVLPTRSIPPDWKVSQIKQQMNGIKVVRVLSDYPPAGYDSHCVEPTLEDVFLYEVGPISC